MSKKWGAAAPQPPRLLHAWVGLTLKARMRNKQVRARVAVGELTEKFKGNQTTLVGTSCEERGKLCRKEGGSGGGPTKKKRKTKTEMERLCKE